MPSKVIKSLKTPEHGYPHRSHKSKRGRKKTYWPTKRRRIACGMRQQKRAAKETKQTKKGLLNQIVEVKDGGCILKKDAG
jgi:hypothetical protein